jgi:AcrR family transcriptional regulator
VRTPDATRPDKVRTEASRAERRRVLLDAGVGTLLVDRPWSEIRMADVARAAGVSRQTLYDEFGSRDGTARAYVAAETDRFLALIDEALVPDLDDPRLALVEALEVFLRAAKTSGLLRAIVSRQGNEALLALVTTDGNRVLVDASAHMAEFFLVRWPVSDPARAARLAEHLVRLALSHATLPTADARTSALAVGDLLGPYLLEMTGLAP